MASKTLCRLCSLNCNNFKFLFDKDGKISPVYKIAVKYFHSSLLDSGTDNTLKVICLECWQHINDFNNFQISILNARTLQGDLEFIVYDENQYDQMSTFDIIDFKLEDVPDTNSTKSTNSVLTSINHSIKDKENDVAKCTVQLECYKCKRLFLSIFELKSHFHQLHPTEKFYVICCNSKFNDRLSFAEHLLVFHNQKDENPFKCETCGASFSQYGNLRRHMRRKHKVHPLFKWICQYCNKMFKNRSQLERHNYMIHKTQLRNRLEKTQYNKQENEECVENFYIKSDSEKETEMDLNYKTNELSQHIKNDNIDIHSNVETKKLILTSTSPVMQIQMPALDIVDIKEENTTDTENEPTTNMLPKTVNFIETNTNAVEDDEVDFLSKWSGDLDCPKCKKHVQNYSQLSEHFILQHPEESCYINCCHMTLNNSTSIAKHLRFHENPHAFKCGDCGKCFKNTKGLRSHKLQVHSNTRSSYHLHLCYCKKSKKLQGQKIDYDTIACCQRKKKIIEDDALISEWKKELVCEICKDTFSHYSLMRVHFYHEHPGEKCYISCCQRKMSRISDTLEHIRCHLNPHTYHCKLCNVTFSGRQGLAKHMRNTHVNAEPKHQWACDECDKTFKIRQILTRHKNVYHSKEV